MGRTLATAGAIILTEQAELNDFRRALRKIDQESLDELFVYARKHVAAITMATHALPFETVLLAMLLEEHSENRRLRREFDDLKAQLQASFREGS
jgi:hypothetical protein